MKEIKQYSLPVYKDPKWKRNIKDFTALYLPIITFIYVFYRDFGAKFGLFSWDIAHTILEVIIVFWLLISAYSYTRALNDGRLKTQYRIIKNYCNYANEEFIYEDLLYKFKYPLNKKNKLWKQPLLIDAEGPFCPICKAPMHIAIISDGICDFENNVTCQNGHIKKTYQCKVFKSLPTKAKFNFIQRISPGKAVHPEFLPGCGENEER